MIDHKNNTATGKPTYYRPPSCDKPGLKECPFCGDQKWNSTPRRSEVAELLRLVDEVASEDDKLNADVKLMILFTHADKMRKEWRL